MNNIPINAGGDQVSEAQIFSDRTPQMSAVRDIKAKQSDHIPSEANERDNIGQSASFTRP